MTLSGVPKKNLSSSTKKGKQKVRPEERFRDMTNRETIAQLSKGYVPPNTEKNTGWAINVYLQWRDARNARGRPVPEILQKPYDCSLLSDWLAVFITEARKTDGEKFPAKTLYQLLCGVLRFMRKQDPLAPNFLDQTDGRFQELRGTCESVFRQLHLSGIGANPKKAPVISREEENRLWETGVLGCSTPKALQRSVYFYLGKNFCKNRSGGLK